MTRATRRSMTAMMVLSASLFVQAVWAQEFELDVNRHHRPSLDSDKEQTPKDSAVVILNGLDLDWEGTQAREVKQLTGILSNGVHPVTNGVAAWDYEMITGLRHAGYPGLSPWNWEFHNQGVVHTSDYLRRVPLTFTGSLDRWSTSQLVQVDLDAAQLAAVFGDWFPDPAGRHAYYAVLQGVHFEAETSMGPIALWAAAEVVNPDNRPDSNNVLYVDLSSAFRGPVNAFDYTITFTLELVGIDTRVWGAEKVDAPTYDSSTGLSEYTEIVTVDLAGPLYWPENDGPVFTQIDEQVFWNQSSWTNEMFVGLSAIGHDYDQWVGGDPDGGWDAGTEYPYSAYEIDRWFSNVRVLDYDSDSERAVVQFTGGTLGYRGTLPLAGYAINMPHNMTAAYLFYCRYTDHAFVEQFVETGSEQP